MRHAARGRAGFTLLEMLAVIAVLAVLASLLFPVVSNAVMAGNRAKCASNMRQIGLALHLFANDNGGMLPVTSHSTGDSRFRVNGQWVNTIDYSWIYTLADYLDNVDEVRICPAEEKERREKILQLNATSYLMNDAIADSEDYRRLNRLPSPMQTMLMFVSNRPVSRTWDHAHCEEWNTWPAVHADIAPDRHRVGGRDTQRLKGSANYLYADGHVRNLAAPEMKEILDSGQKPWLPEGLVR